MRFINSKITKTKLKDIIVIKGTICSSNQNSKGLGNEAKGLTFMKNIKYTCISFGQYRTSPLNHTFLN